MDSKILFENKNFYINFFSFHYIIDIINIYLHLLNLDVYTNYV